MKDIALSNGVTLSVAPAPYKDASRLKNKVVNQLMSEGFDLKDLNSKDIMKTNISKDLIFDVIKRVALLESSEEVEELVIKCAERCLYNKEKITLDTFEDSEVWPVVIEIKIEVIKANVLPFFLSLPSIVKRLTSSIDLGTLLK